MNFFFQISKMSLMLTITDVEAETPILWPPDAKSWLVGKDPDAGKDWGQEERRMTEDEMVGWHHWLNGHEFGQTPGIGDGQGGLVCCGSWSSKELVMTERLNWIGTDYSLIINLIFFTKFCHFVITVFFTKSPLYKDHYPYFLVK